MVSFVVYVSFLTWKILILGVASICRFYKICQYWKSGLSWPHYDIIWVAMSHPCRRKLLEEYYFLSYFNEWVGVWLKSFVTPFFSKSVFYGKFVLFYSMELLSSFFFFFFEGGMIMILVRKWCGIWFHRRAAFSFVLLRFYRHY